MCAYDTTLADTIDEPRVPECLKRNRLDTVYFPSTSRAAFAAIAALSIVFLLTSFNRLNHTDLWGHLNFGRWMAAHGLPEHDPFAADPSARRALNPAWLAQITGYAVHAWGGPEALVLGHALLVTAAVGLLMLAVSLRGTSAPWSIGAGLVAFGLALPVMGTIRPQLFGMIGVASVLIACAGPPRRWTLWFLPALMAVWANLHGSFAIGLALLGLHAACGTAELLARTRSIPKTVADPAFVRHWLGLALAVAGACLNPLGPRLLVAVARFGSGDALADITEWQRLSLGSLSGVLMAGSVVATVCMLRASTRRIQLFELAVLVVFASLTLSSMRMLAWWALVCPWVVAPHAMAAWRHLRKKQGATGGPAADTGDPKMRTLIALGCVFVALMIAPPAQGLIAGHPRGIGATVSSDTPLYVAAELSRRGASGRIFAPMDWADYLVWSSHARLRPLAHSHVHLIDADCWQDYRLLASGSDRWLDVVQRRNLEYLVVARTRQVQLKKRLLAESARSGRVRIVYQDQMCLVARVHSADAAE